MYLPTLSGPRIQGQHEPDYLLFCSAGLARQSAMWPKLPNTLRVLSFTAPSSMHAGLEEQPTPWAQLLTSGKDMERVSN
jgi:hypothetical protein